MALSKMNESDRRIIFECLAAAARGPFFCDADISILFGLDRSELLGIVARIPRIDDAAPNVRRAIGHTLNNLLGYPHGEKDEWNKWISVSPATLEIVADRWRSLQPRIVFESVEIVGPACFDKKFYRVIKYRVRGGGSGLSSEVWSDGRWTFANDGPGVPAIMSAIPASSEQLDQAGVCNTMPSYFDPFSIDREAQ